jgi:hypothetical protein
MKCLAAGRLVSSLALATSAMLLMWCSRRDQHPSPEPAFTSTAAASGSGQGGSMGRTPKDEATDLMNMLLPFAEQMLREHGEFYPYGGVMMPDGSMQHFGATDGTEHPKSSDLIDLLLTQFREGGRQGRYKVPASSTTS